MGPDVALDRKHTIDFLAIAHDGSIVLVLAAFLDDHEEMENLRLMQDKLHRYLDFIESGEVYERATEVAKRTVPPTTPVRIEIVANRDLQQPICSRFLSAVADACKEVGVGFLFRVSTEG